MKKSGRNIIYFDNGATSFPKPRTVIQGVDRCISEYCGNPGRSSHRLSAAASKAIYTSREKLAAFLRCGKPENTVFTYNATYALNTAIHSLIKPQSSVIISNIEHNSVIRPLHAMNAKLSVFNSFASEETVLADIENRLRSGASAVVCNHASNICSAVNPVEKIGELCKKYGAVYIVDISQSAGHFDIDLGRLHADAVCAPFHKGLFGIQGGGFVMFGESVDPESIPQFISGGNGMNSFDRNMPNVFPERLEAGTLSTPAAVSLSCGIDYINSVGLENIAEREKSISRKIGNMLASMKNVTLYGNGVGPGSTLLFNIDGFTSYETAEILDRSGICVRPGFHCSPLAHEYLKTGDSGAVRLSFSCMNTQSEAERFYDAIKRIKT